MSVNGTNSPFRRDRRTTFLGLLMGLPVPSSFTMVAVNVPIEDDSGEGEGTGRARAIFCICVMVTIATQGAGWPPVYATVRPSFDSRVVDACKAQTLSVA
jgi:hypothetical protein